MLWAIAAGDQTAAEAFDKQFRAQLRRFLYGWAPEQDFDDLLQQTFQAAMKAIRTASYRGESSVGTWLVGILMHKLSDYRQARGRINSLEVIGIAGVFECPTTNHQNLDLKLDMKAALQNLPKLHRSVLLLNVRDGMSTTAIAKAISLPPGTVGRVLWEAKQQVREYLCLKKSLHGTD
jgi:RNA polymerase sigma factor (sigma-70 family)